MIDWHAPMQQTFDFYLVDPSTWTDKQKLAYVTKGKILRDLSAETLGSASFNVTEDNGEYYIRTYLVVTQDGQTERFPLGVHLCQTSDNQYDGKNNDISIDAYTPLLELKDNSPDFGYTVMSTSNVLNAAYLLLRSSIRAPIVKSSDTATVGTNFSANLDDNYLTFIKDLLDIANYELALDDWGRVLFSPKIDISSMRPVYTFDDGNSSILYPEVTKSRDLYGIPNAVEVIYSQDDSLFYARVENHDPSSPVSIATRGRVVLHRDTNPNLPGTPTQSAIESYARTLLRDMSSLEYKITYTHGFIPTVSVGDCVRLNYERAGLENVRAKVIKQTITLEPGCPVEETSVYTEYLWTGKQARIRYVVGDWDAYILADSDGSLILGEAYV